MAPSYRCIQVDEAPPSQFIAEKGSRMTLSKSQPSTRLLLSRLTAAVRTFQSHREDAPLNMLMLFLFISGRSEGVGAAELGRLAGISPASVSRNVQALGRGKEGEPGMGLVAKFIDLLNPRAHSIKLTPRGDALALEMAGMIHVEAVASSDGRHQATKGVHWQNWADW